MLDGSYDGFSYCPSDLLPPLVLSCRYFTIDGQECVNPGPIGHVWHTPTVEFYIQPLGSRLTHDLCGVNVF